MNHSNDDLIIINGADGEGGGQILRTALTLSLITGRGFRIDNIRARRRKPGLLRQHLTAVQAAAQIGEAHTEGAQTASQQLVFRPHALRGGELEFAIGTAGSCILVLHTILPALIAAGIGARIRLSGGTHNPQAPPADALQRAYLPLLKRMGAELSCTLLRYGFFPAGGGELIVEIAPHSGLRPLHLLERGPFRQANAEALIVALPIHIAKRELATLQHILGWGDSQLKPHGLRNSHGPGNVLVATLEYEQVTEVFTSFGEKRISAEEVAKQLAQQVQAYMDSDVPVGPYLADQLLVPLVIAGGSFITGPLSSHTRTNLETIERFLPGRLSYQEQEPGKLLIQARSESFI